MAATADALYGLTASLGLAALSSLVVGSGVLVKVAGSGYLLVLGIRTFLARPATQQARAAPTGDPWRAWASALALTLANPMTIATGKPQGRALYTPILVGGIFLGSGAWWLILSAGVSRLRQRLREIHVLWVNRFAGVLLVGFARWAFVSVGTSA